MRRFAVMGAGLLSIAGFAGVASAADLLVKAPAISAAPEQFSWTGCHVGGHVGGVVGEDRTTNVLGNSIDFSSTGSWEADRSLRLSVRARLGRGGRRPGSLVQPEKQPCFLCQKPGSGGNGSVAIHPHQ